MRMSVAMTTLNSNTYTYTKYNKWCRNGELVFKSLTQRMKNKPILSH